MFALRSKEKERAADPRSERNPLAFGAVRCPKCETKIEVRGWTSDARGRVFGPLPVLR